MKRPFLTTVLFLLASAPVLATFELDDPAQPVNGNEMKQLFKGGDGSDVSIRLEKKDYLKLVVGNYVHGFNEFNTSIETSDDTVNIGIYYGSNEQDRSSAERLAERFRQQLPSVLGEYGWARDVSVQVLVSSAGHDHMNP